jgi:hypothetical protein
MNTASIAAYVIATDTFCCAAAATREECIAQLAAVPFDVRESFADVEPRPALVDDLSSPRRWTFCSDEFFGAEITVRVGRAALDPQGLSSDDEIAEAEEWILDALRVEEFHGATVRAVTDAGNYSGVTRDGRTFNEEVRRAARAAWEAFLNA